MGQPSPARGITALSNVVSAGRSAARSAASSAARLSAAAVRVASGALAAFDTGGAARGRAAATPGALESLEVRRMLSSVTLSNGVLSVVGNLSESNELVDQPRDSSNLYAYANGVNRTVPRSSVRSVRFMGGSGADDVFLASSLSIPADVKTGAGNDRIWLARGDDTVDAGDGNDTIWSRPGDDKVLGGAGDDTFKGDTGNDYFDGGAGNDLAEGEEGDDTLKGGDGSDKLFGGPDDDMPDGGLGSHSL